MNRILTGFPLVLATASVDAALPPQYQNVKDLDVMVAYVRAHPDVAAGLTSIDLSDYVIRYGEGCRAVFGRKVTTKPVGWVGPADPLEFKTSSCPAE